MDDNDELTKAERQRRRQHAIDLVKHQTVHNQPALIPRERLGVLEDYAANGRDDEKRGRAYLDEGLKAAVEHDELIRQTAPDGTAYYGYPGDLEYLNAIVDAVVTWSPVPKSLVGWCNVRIDERREVA